MNDTKHPAEALADALDAWDGKLMMPAGWRERAAGMLRTIPALDAEIARLTAALDDAQAAESVAQALRADDLRRFLDVAAGEGYVFDGVDAGDLFLRMFPEHYDAAREAQ